MKYWLLFAFLFVSIVYASVKFQTGMVGTTRLNGDGCLCHNLSPDPTVNVWIEGPDSLEFGQTAQYKVFVSGGPAVVGGFNVAARFGALNVADSNTHKIDFELTHSFPRPFVNNQTSWSFNYTAGSAQIIDTLYSTALSANGDELPSGSIDRWNFGPNKTVTILQFVPVELTSFTASTVEGNVLLSWSTSSETNNHGFAVERKIDSDWTTIGYVNGNGTSTNLNHYSFIDINPANGVNYYRLNQLDLNGTSSYSDIVEVSFTPAHFILSQNYPNPFNPSTTINFEIPVAGNVKLSVYNVSAEQVAVVTDNVYEAGKHSLKFNAEHLPSGIYFYKLEFNNYSLFRKMILLK